MRLRAESAVRLCRRRFARTLFCLWDRRGLVYQNGPTARRARAVSGIFRLRLFRRHLRLKDLPSRTIHSFRTHSLPSLSAHSLSVGQKNGKQACLLSGKAPFADRHQPQPRGHRRTAFRNFGRIQGDTDHFCRPEHQRGRRGRQGIHTRLRNRKRLQIVRQLPHVYGARLGKRPQQADRRRVRKRKNKPHRYSLRSGRIVRQSKRRLICGQPTDRGLSKIHAGDGKRGFGTATARQPGAGRQRDSQKYSARTERAFNYLFRKRKTAQRRAFEGGNRLLRGADRGRRGQPHPLPRHFRQSGRKKDSRNRFPRARRAVDYLRTADVEQVLLYSAQKTLFRRGVRRGDSHQDGRNRQRRHAFRHQDRRKTVYDRPFRRHGQRRIRAPYLRKHDIPAGELLPRENALLACAFHHQ